jgi:hypothetical protein
MQLVTLLMQTLQLYPRTVQCALTIRQHRTMQRQHATATLR